MVVVVADVEVGVVNTDTGAVAVPCVSTIDCVTACVYACVHAYARKVRTRACAHACVCARVRVCARACVCVCAYARVLLHVSESGCAWPLLVSQPLTAGNDVWPLLVSR